MFIFYIFKDFFAVSRFKFHDHISSDMVHLMMSHPSFLQFHRGQRAANLQIQVHQNRLRLLLNRQVQKVKTAQIVKQRMKVKAKQKMKKEGKIGSWTLLIWKTLKHCTDSGTGTVITFKVQFISIVQQTYVIKRVDTSLIYH